MLNKKPDIENEMDEIQRTSQDLSRDDGIDISVKEIVNGFKESKEQILSNDIWKKLENTESNEIQKGDFESVLNIAKKYKKTSPKKLSKLLKSGDYERPLILNIGERYILISGNTRLSTAASIGIKPKVFISKIQNMKKKDTNEVTDSGSSGAFSAPMSTSTNSIKKNNNFKEYNKKEEFKEATTTDVSSSGQYDTPFGGGPKGRRDPLKIDGPKSIKNSRAVKDKNFPKWGGPNAVFVKIKEKCKKFPYCNQGIDAIELLEMDELNEAVNETSKKLGLPKKEIEKIVLNEINKIFI